MAVRRSCYLTANAPSRSDFHVFQKTFWPRGKVLGGTSAINAMIWVRGSRHDYDHWAQNGAEGWSYAEVLPYFIRMEDSKAAHVDAGKDDII